MTGFPFSCRIPPDAILQSMGSKDSHRRPRRKRNSPGTAVIRACRSGSVESGSVRRSGHDSGHDVIRADGSLCIRPVTSCYPFSAYALSDFRRPGIFRPPETAYLTLSDALRKIDMCVSPPLKQGGFGGRFAMYCRTAFLPYI